MRDVPVLDQLKHKSKLFMIAHGDLGRGGPVVNNRVKVLMQLLPDLSIPASLLLLSLRAQSSPQLLHMLDQRVVVRKQGSIFRRTRDVPNNSCSPSLTASSLVRRVLYDTARSGGPFQRCFKDRYPVGNISVVVVSFNVFVSR